ncbi:hypothetical protein ACQKOE_13735 [Novosphingobium sp. NPDC080210]|uniref:hypothetical protein n=1 Tax=Novosphingobium sp. NPDC080210 TaxID=3390596 RepID=UPI003CFE574F
MTEDKALVKRLRAWEPLVSTGYEVPAAGQAIYEASDRIEALTAENERLREALKGVLDLQFGAEGYAKVIARAALEGKQ